MRIPKREQIIISIDGLSADSLYGLSFTRRWDAGTKNNNNINIIILYKSRHPIVGPK